MRNLSLLMILLAITSPCAFADEGELQVGLETSGGWAWFPSPTTQKGFDSSGFMQRASFPLSYGITDSWHFGIDPGIAWNYSDIVFSNFDIAHQSGNLHSRLLWMTLPATLSFRLSSGTDYSTTFELFGGYSLLNRSNRFMERDGFLILEGKEIPSTWTHGAMFGTQVLFEARVADWFIVQGGPTIAASYMNGWGLFAGATVKLLFAFGVG